MIDNKRNFLRTTFYTPTETHSFTSHNRSVIKFVHPTTKKNLAYDNTDYNKSVYSTHGFHTSDNICGYKIITTETSKGEKTYPDIDRIERLIFVVDNGTTIILSVTGSLFYRWLVSRFVDDDAVDNNGRILRDSRVRDFLLARKKPIEDGFDLNSIEPTIYRRIIIDDPTFENPEHTVRDQYVLRVRLKD